MVGPTYVAFFFGTCILYVVCVLFEGFHFIVTVTSVVEPAGAAKTDVWVPVRSHHLSSLISSQLGHLSSIYASISKGSI